MAWTHPELSSEKALITSSVSHPSTSDLCCGDALSTLQCQPLQQGQGCLVVTLVLPTPPGQGQGSRGCLEISAMLLFLYLAHLSEGFSLLLGALRNQHNTKQTPKASLRSSSSFHTAFVTWLT